MQYLIKEFCANKHCGYLLHLVTDDGTELTAGSLWNWIWLAKRDGVEISVHRLIEDVSKVEIHDQILVVDQEGNPEIQRSHDTQSVAELDADPSLKCYRLECVLDLS